MTAMLLFMEGIVMCFVLLLVCVVGIANGPVGLVVLYEQDVQDRVVELGYITRERIHRNFIIACIALFAPSFVLVPYMVYGINGASGFFAPFWQMTGVSRVISTARMSPGNFDAKAIMPGPPRAV